MSVSDEPFVPDPPDLPDELDGSPSPSTLAGLELSGRLLERMRLTGANFSTAKIGDAVFVDCRIDIASFRSAKLERVRFEECPMDEIDFSGATLDSVVFADCSLTRATWASATLRRSEMRRCDLTGSINPQRLRGVRMPRLVMDTPRCRSDG